MTRLKAIENIMEACGLPMPSAVASSGTWPNLTYQTTDAGDAERILDRECETILSEGWFLNTTENFNAYRANYYWTYTGAVTGTFTYGEQITQVGNASLRAYFLYHDSANKFIYIYVRTGTPLAAGDLAGADSGATVTTESAITAVTSGKIAGNPLWIKTETTDAEQKSVMMAYNSTFATNFFTDLAPEFGESTQTFTVASISLNVVRKLEFTTLPQTLQEYVMRAAAQAFQWYKKRGTEDNAFNANRLAVARGRWMAENGRMRKTNMFTTPEMQAFRGGREPSVGLTN